MGEKEENIGATIQYFIVIHVAPSGAQDIREMPFHFSFFDLIESRYNPLGWGSASREAAT
jgi:hypothetical protein